MKNKIFKKSRTQTKFLCYNGIMLKTKTKVIIGFVGIISAVSGIQASNLVASQVGAATCSNTATAPDHAKCNMTFQVNVVDSLSVTLTLPDSWASGSMNTFLRNDVTLDVSTNNENGFTASMYANNTSSGVTAATDLLNTSDSTTTIKTLEDNKTRGDFPANYWGFSLSDYSAANSSDTSVGDTSGGSDAGLYKPLVADSTSPTVVLYSDKAASLSQDIYFGTKADATKPAGIYRGTVVISAVTDTVDPDNNPVTPVNPATDQDTSTTNPSYSYSNVNNVNRTTYTRTSTDSEAGTTSTQTIVSSGDNTESYANALGVTETTASVSSGAPLATGLAVAAGVAAVSGIFFFILAKRDDDDDDEEEENMV